jgi:L,D-transpeptidase ErfK/SrfK
MTFIEGTKNVSARVLRAACAAAIGLMLSAADVVHKEDMVGEIRHYTIQKEDTLLDVARQYDLGYVELVAANPGVDAWIPKPGTRILLPTAHLIPDAPREGIVINVAEMRLYYFPADAGGVVTFPIGIGVEGWGTPLGTTRVVSKREHPTWTPPESIRIEHHGDLPAFVPPGPDNPLGDFALDLGWPRYLIHGTNKPYGVGRRVSHGCIRLYPEDIKRLFGWVPVGTPVTVVDQQVKLGWVKGELYLEVHPSLAEANDIEIGTTPVPKPIPDLRERVKAAAGSKAGQVDWLLVDRTARDRRGIPVRITRGL